MSLLRIDPFGAFDKITRRMGTLADEYDKGFNIEFGSFSPRVDVTEDEKGMYFHAELPGVKKEDVKVSINDENVLLINGTKAKTKKDEGEESGVKYLKVERGYGEFTRQFILPDNLNNESIKAKYEDGILDISFEKIEPVKPNTINVEIS